MDLKQGLRKRVSESSYSIHLKHALRVQNYSLLSESLKSKISNMGFTPLTEAKYSGGSISNILPSFAKVYAIQPRDGIKRAPLFPQIHKHLESLAKKSKRIVIFEIDGLGFDRLVKVRKRFSFLNQAVFKITSTFPTYTHSAFTSFITGTPPSIHGLVAGTFKLDGEIKWVGEISNREKKNLILAESLLWAFEKRGHRIHSILYDVNNGHYSKVLYPNRNFVSSQFSGKDNLVTEAKTVEKRVFEKVQDFARKDFFILTAYFWYLDGITGKYGKFSQQSINHCVFLFKEIGRLNRIFPKDTLFLFFGDHGHTSLKKNVLLNQDHLREISTLSGAELALDGRTLMFYSQKPNLTKKLFEKYYGQYTDEISRKDYIELLGRNCSTEVKNRIGSLIYLAKSHYTLRLKPKKSKATHGGGSKKEMETVLGFWKN